MEKIKPNSKWVISNIETTLNKSLTFINNVATIKYPSYTLNIVKHDDLTFEVRIYYDFNEIENKFLVIHNNEYWNSYGYEWDTKIIDGKWVNSKSFQYDISECNIDSLINRTLPLVQERIQPYLFLTNYDIPLIEFWKTLNKEVITNNYTSNPNIFKKIEDKVFDAFYRRCSNRSNDNSLDGFEKVFALSKDELKNILLPANKTLNELRNVFYYAKNILELKYTNCIDKQPYEEWHYNNPKKRFQVTSKTIHENLHEIRIGGFADPISITTEYKDNIQVFYNSKENKLQLGVSEVDNDLASPLTATIEVDGIIFDNNFGTCDDFIIEQLHHGNKHRASVGNNKKRQLMLDYISNENMVFGQGSGPYFIYENDNDFLIVHCEAFHIENESPKLVYINRKLIEIDRPYTKSEQANLDLLEMLENEYVKLGEIDGAVWRWQAWSKTDYIRVTNQMKIVKNEIETTVENPTREDYRNKNVESIYDLNSDNNESIESNYKGNLRLEQYYNTNSSYLNEFIAARLIKS